MRKLQAARDADRDRPPVPAEIAAKLRDFGFLTPDGASVTDQGREALLEQDMRDAEQR